MCNIKKNRLSAVIGFSAFCLCLPVTMHAAGKDEMLRKLLGLGGACLVLNGLYKFVNFHPIKGISRIITGTVIGVGGICSDIIIQRCRDLYEQSRPEPQSQNLGQDMLRAVARGVSKFKDKESRFQLSRGRDSFLSGNILTGMEQMYDGMYKGVRAECVRILADE
jgi:hypothetical protein